MGAKEGALREGDGEGGEDVEDRVERVDALSGLRCDEGHTGWGWRVREREKGQTKERGGMSVAKLFEEVAQILVGLLRQYRQKSHK